LDVEIFRFECLEKAWKEAILPSEKEHVTSYIRNNVEKFTHSNVKSSQDLSSMRWTVDEPEDFEFIEKVYQKLYSENTGFNMSDVLAYLQNHPNLTKINKHIQRNEGKKKSYELDRIFLEGSDK
jgi:spore coat polysaccharide biosynthesis protein SpsF (cytidylyltransferase family)